MKSVNWKDAGIRALKTAVAVFIVSVPGDEIVNGSLEAEKAAALVAGAAAVTYIWNVLLDWTRDDTDA